MVSDKNSSDFITDIQVTRLRIVHVLASVARNNLMSYGIWQTVLYNGLILLKAKHVGIGIYLNVT